MERRASSDAEMEFVGHRRVFAQQSLLVRAKAVVDVVACLRSMPDSQKSMPRDPSTRPINVSTSTLR